MFDRAKQRVQKLEETNETFRKVSTHIQENKRTYIVGAGMFVVGMHFKRPINVVVENAPNFAPTFNNTVSPVMQNIGNQMTNNIGRCCKIVEDLQTGEMVKQVNRMAEKIAEENNVSFETARQMLSAHLNGRLEHVFNKTYRAYLATTE